MRKLSTASMLKCGHALNSLLVCIQKVTIGPRQHSQPALEAHGLCRELDPAHTLQSTDGSVPAPERVAAEGYNNSVNDDDKIPTDSAQKLSPDSFSHSGQAPETLLTSQDSVTLGATHTSI